MGKLTRERLYAGTAKVIISPAEQDIIEYRSLGKEQFCGVQQELYARIVVLGGEHRKIVIIGCDLINLPDYALFCSQLATRYGLKQTDIIVGATQNHQSIVTDPPRMEPGQRPPVLLRIRDAIHQAVSAGVGQAIAAMEPARIGWGSGVSAVNASKDLDIGAQMVLISDLAKQTDRELFILRVITEAGLPLAAILNYSVQGTLMGGRADTWIGGDLQGAVSAKLEAYFGGNFIAPYLIGASAELVPLVTGAVNTLQMSDGRIRVESREIPQEARLILLDWLAGIHAFDAIELFSKIDCSIGYAGFRSGEIYTEADARITPSTRADDDPRQRDPAGTLTHRIHLLSIDDRLALVCGNSITSNRLAGHVKQVLPCKTVYISVEGGISGYVVGPGSDPREFSDRYCPFYSPVESEMIYVDGARRLFAEAD